jgi:hypothetical protein
MDEKEIEQLKLLLSIRMNDLSSALSNVLNGMESEILRLNKEVIMLKSKEIKKVKD